MRLAFRQTHLYRFVNLWAIYEKDATRKYPSLSIDTARSNTENKLPSDAYRKILPKTPESPSVPYIPCQDKQSLGISVSSGAIIFYSVSMVPLEALQLMGLFDIIINITKEVTT